MRTNPNNGAIVRLIALATIGPAAAANADAIQDWNTITITSTGVIAGTTGPDELTGTTGDDTINGRGDADLMIGLAGNDTYIVDNAEDVIVESAGEGTDTIRAFVSCFLPANVENLVQQGTGDSRGVGNRLANRIIGNSGHNTLDGGPGNDTLTGRAGPDTFVFTSELNGTTNVDHLTDFNVLEDKILLHYRAFSALPAGVMMLGAARFHVGAFATTASQNILYNPITGGLSYDADGTGSIAPVRFARLAVGLALTSQNFAVWPQCGGRLLCP
jgi:Ca2+-binding RTX toxin-like protein